MTSILNDSKKLVTLFFETIFMTMKLYRFLFAVALILSCAAASYAQEVEKRALTQEEIVGRLPQGIVNQLPMVTGWKDAKTVNLAQREGRGYKMYEYNIKTGEKVAVENAPKEMNPAPEAMEKFRKLPLAKEVKNPTLSPDGIKVAFTDKDNNLCVWNSLDGKVAKLTSDGTNVIMNGYASWVYYEEILGRPSRYRAFWWSPDSRTIAFYKFDDSEISMFPIYDSRGKHGFITETRYPKAGDKNPEVKIAFVNVEDGATVWADFDHTLDQYFGIPFWNADGSRFIIPWMPREQNNLVLYTVNPADGSKESIYNENQMTWIDWMEDMQFVEDGFFMVRDFEMWEQIYFQSFDGKRLEKITDGKNWGIRFVKVDMKEGSIYFTARREVSTRNDFYRVDLKTKKITRLSFGEYNFTGVRISPDNKFFVAQYSNSTTPTRLAVVDVKGAAKASSAKVAPKVAFEKSSGVKVIADSKGEKFDQYKLAIPQMLSITVDGYVLPAQVIWPVDLDPSKKYPVLVSMYGGPNAGTVMDTWKGIGENNQWWANEGVIQISIDHRASGHCGKEGLNYLHRNLLNIELKDYIEWIKYLRAEFPFVNADKVGITGFSYGGSMTTLACTEGSDYFKYGIAGGGVYDYQLYDTHYAERYMDRPQDNPEGYANTVLGNRIAKYKGDKTNYLKITHGTSDDNVHMQNTMHLINAMQDAGKQFDLMMYPGEFHGYRGKKSVHSKAGDYIFWYRHLLEKEAPAILLP